MRLSLAAALLGSLLFAGCESMLWLDNEAPAAAGASFSSVPSSLKPGGDWAKVRALEDMAWDVDKDQAVQKLTPQVRRDPRANLPALVRVLVSGKASDFERVRAIHDWEARNIAYDVAAFRGSGPMVTEPYAVIKHGSSVCYGYSQLFAQMCSMAGIECRVLTGYGRGVGFDPFARQVIASNHAWNAVRIEGGWYLVDVTWDSGALGADDRWSPGYSRSFLFTPPEAFLCSHFPDDGRWQLLQQPLSASQLVALPHLEGQFGKCGFRAQSLRLVAAVGSEYECTLGAAAGWQLKGFLSRVGAASGQDWNEAGVMPGPGGTLRLTVFFPSAGRYQLDLNAYRDGDDRNPLLVGTLYFTASSGSTKRLPYFVTTAARASLALDAASGYEYRVGRIARISFAMSGQPLVTLMDANNRLQQDAAVLAKDGDRWAATVTFPARGRYTVWVSAPEPGGNRWTGVASLSYEAAW